MVSVRKRHRDEEDKTLEPAPRQSELPAMLLRLRNMWQFACLCQWFYIFGAAVNLDNVDINELEAQCLSLHSTALQDMGLALLKCLSSHRGLTNELFDEYTRRQYISKAPELPNPFGTGEVPAKFSEFTISQKIRILHQMTLFVMMNPEKLRERMAEQKDVDHDQTTWRIEPFGWDRHDRAYYVLDDNRVYRLTEAPLPAAPAKRNSKKARAQAKRSNKRRRISSLDDPDNVNSVAGAQDDGKVPSADPTTEDDLDDGLGGMKWECVAVSLDDLRTLLASIPGRRDPNEKLLHEKLVEHLLPILEQDEEKRKRREREREKELLNLAKMASAKRSSRIASRQEQQRQDEIRREEERKRRAELEALQRAEQKQRKMEEERDSRLLTREKRLQEREHRRTQHRKELAQLSKDNQIFDGHSDRMSERRRLTEIQKNEEALRELEHGEEEWVFDCICGLHGKVDDGQHSVSCEKCNIWQHSRCLGIDEAEAEKDDFHFVCATCMSKAEDAANEHASESRPVIKIKLNKPSTATMAESSVPSVAWPRGTCQINTDIAVAPRPSDADRPPTTGPPAEAAASWTGGYSSVVNGGAAVQAPTPALLRPLPVPTSNQNVPIKIDGVAPRSQQTAENEASTTSVQEAATLQNGQVNPSTQPHPGLHWPDQSPRKLHAYGTIHEQHPPVPQSDWLPNSKDDAGPPTPSPTFASNGPQGNTMQRAPALFATPRLQLPQRDAVTTEHEPSLSPLIPSYGGLSPTKQSPASVRGPPDSTRSKPPIISTAPELSPSAPEQNLTPPVKPGGSAQRSSFSNIAPGIPSSRVVEH